MQVHVSLERGPFYLGQRIQLAVSATAGRERPEILAPTLDPTSAVLALEGTAFQPIMTSAIGDVVTETNRYTFRFRIVPRRAGRLEIPAFVLRIGNHAEPSSRTRLDVRNAPLEGRPPTFLGGVGPFELSAEATPAAVRIGQSFEYRVVLTGPGAIGAVHAPDLSRFRELAIKPSIELLPSEEIVWPALRAFRYKVRPLHSGAVTLPPVVVSSFDPATGRYQTKASSGVPVRVVDVSAFDSAAVRYDAPDMTHRNPALCSRRGCSPRSSAD
jgi:hypothetical protein